MSEPLSVTIAIPTFRRPQELRLLLAALPERIAEAECFGHATQQEVTVRTVVVDNDPAGSAHRVVAAAPVPADYAIEPEPGIAAVRNQLLDRASNSRLIAFIDDDERPLENWLSALLETWHAWGEPAAVMGRVISVFETGLEPWLDHTGVFRRRERRTGTQRPVAAAGNLLLDLQQVRAAGLRFDVSLGLAGGEDTLFTRQLTAAGGRIIWCNESRAKDHVPTERTTREWAMRRAFNGGNASTQVDLRMSSSQLGRLGVRFYRFAGGAARVVAGSLRHLAGKVLGDTRNEAWGLRTAHRGMGMVAAAVGHHHQHYARTTAEKVGT